MDRRTARDTAFGLLFEHEFKKDEDAETTVRLAVDSREIETDKYVEAVYFGVLEHLAEIDEIITTRSIGWKTKRMTKTSLTVMRIAVYEMKYIPEIPYSVAINEAVELSKTYDEEKASAFVNGILNAIAEDLGMKKEK